MIVIDCQPTETENRKYLYHLRWGSSSLFLPLLSDRGRQMIRILDNGLLTKLISVELMIRWVNKCDKKSREWTMCDSIHNSLLHLQHHDVTLLLGNKWFTSHTIHRPFGTRGALAELPSAPTYS